MPLSDVSNAIYYYLQPVNSNIPNFGTLYQALPKVASEADLFSNSYPGAGMGATIFMFFTNQSERRVAFGGQHQGRKFRHYNLGLLTVFKSDLAATEDGQIAYNTFIDDLTAWIQADRNAWTEAANLGGQGPYVGTGVVFSWGEGPISGGGDDLVFDHIIPRTLAGGVTIFQSVAHVTVVESLST